MLVYFKVPIGWSELARRTYRDALADDVLGLAAQLAYYFFLALFPALLCLLAFASLLPVERVIDDMMAAVGRVAPPSIVPLIRDQILKIAAGQQGGLLTLGFLGALWSSSSAIVAIVGALNRAYDIEEGRPWWKKRLVAIALTLGVALLVLAALAIFVAGPAIGSFAAQRIGAGELFEATWQVLQWPLAFFFIVLAVGLIYYFAPDAEQDWVWITPGSVVATALWALASLGFRYYVVTFGSYTETYGALAGVILLLLWFYISGLALLLGAELNAEIEHASSYAKAPGERAPGARKKIGSAAARDYEERMKSRPEELGSLRSRHPARPSIGRWAVVVGGAALGLFRRKVRS